MYPLLDCTLPQGGVYGACYIHTFAMIDGIPTEFDRIYESILIRRANWRKKHPQSKNNKSKKKSRNGRNNSTKKNTRLGEGTSRLGGL